MEHVRGIKIQEAVSLWREIDPGVKNESYHALRSKIRRAAEKGIIDTAWFSGYSHKLYKNTDVIKFAKSLMKSKTVTNCNQTEQPTSDCSQLPKLTAEVFDRPDCPEWAKYAAVDENKSAYWFECKPQAKNTGFWVNRFNRDRSIRYQQIPGAFYSADWQNSLIERPAKLPDWCKVGEWVYLSNAKYYKIKKVDSCGIILADGTVIKTDDIHAEAVSARLRPYNAEEMKALVGQVLKHDTGNYLVTAFEHRWNQVKIESVWRDEDELVKVWTQLDGSPCGVLEHLKNG